jgi:hypothetical protein
MPRAPKSGITLTENDAATIKGMLLRGDRQHDIAAWFGVNGGRIADISTGRKFPTITAKTSELPPSGPYLAGREAEAAMIALEAAKKTINEALELIDERRSKYVKR